MEVGGDLDARGLTWSQWPQLPGIGVPPEVGGGWVGGNVDKAISEGSSTRTQSAWAELVLVTVIVQVTVSEVPWQSRATDSGSFVTVRAGRALEMV